METKSGTCDLFWHMHNQHPSPCEEYAKGNSYAPELHVLQAIATSLHRCRQTQQGCRSVDVGANIGDLTALMVAFGQSHVIAVEPQLDLARALNQTVLVNGWADKVQVLAGLASGRAGGLNGTKLLNAGYRFSEIDMKMTPWEAPFIPLYDIIVGQGGTFDLVKIDTDSVDGELLGMVLQLQKQKIVDIKSVICEFEGGSAQMLFEFQQLGFHIYRLNAHLNFRRFNSEGYDVLNNFTAVLPKSWQGIVEERYSLHYMKYVLKVVRKAKNATEFETLLGTNIPYPLQNKGSFVHWFFTKLDLEQPEEKQHPKFGNPTWRTIYPNKGWGLAKWGGTNTT